MKIEPLIETAKFLDEQGNRTCTLVLNYELPCICIIGAAQGELTRKNMKQLIDYLISKNVKKVKIWRFKGHSVPFATLEDEATIEDETDEGHLRLWVIDLNKYKSGYKRIEHV